MTDSYVNELRIPRDRPGRWARPVAIGALAVLGAIGAAGCKPAGVSGGSPAGAMERPPAPVTVTAATVRDVPVYLEEIGRTTAIETVNVQPQVGGRIMEIHFQDGAEVKRGDPLFTIDTRWYEANLAEAQAAVLQRTAEYQLAKQEFDRVGPLLEKKAISQQEYDLRRSQMDVADAQVKAAQAAVETAKLSVEYCYVKSPIAGRTGQRLVDVGNVVRANEQALLVIQRIDPVYVDFTTSERNLPAVRQHMKDGTLRVEARVPNDNQPPATGELTFLDTAVQPLTGTIKLRATLKNADRRFWAGQFAEVRLILQVKKGAVLVPTRAVQIGQAGPFVYVVKDDMTAEMRPVQQGQRQGDLVVVQSGVNPGDKVVTTGHMGVMPGGKVNPLPPQAAPADGAHAAAAPATRQTSPAAATRPSDDKQLAATTTADGQVKQDRK